MTICPFKKSFFTIVEGCSLSFDANSLIVIVSGIMISLISSCTSSTFCFTGIMNGCLLILPFAGPSSVLCFLSFLLLFLKLFLFTLLEVFFPKPSSTGTLPVASFFLKPCCLLFPKLLLLPLSFEKSLFLSFELLKPLLSLPAKFLFLPSPSLLL